MREYILERKICKCIKCGKIVSIKKIYIGEKLYFRKSNLCRKGFNLIFRFIGNRIYIGE